MLQDNIQYQWPTRGGLSSLLYSLCTHDCAANFALIPATSLQITSGYYYQQFVPDQPQRSYNQNITSTPLTLSGDYEILVCFQLVLPTSTDAP